MKDMVHTVEEDAPSCTLLEFPVGRDVDGTSTRWVKEHARATRENTTIDLALATTWPTGSRCYAAGQVLTLLNQKYW